MNSKIYEDDGRTHLNIYSDGKTKLGRDLSNFTFAPFRHPDHGVFNSIEGYWYWLRSQDDRLRNLYGVEAKQLGRGLARVKTYKPEEFQHLIKLALDAKLRHHPDMMKALVSSSLPMTHYYVMGPERKVIYPDDSLWIIDHFHLIREAANPGIKFDKFSHPAPLHQPKAEPQMGLF